MTRIDKSSAYKKFVKDRNLALDTLLQKSLIRMNNVINELKQVCEEVGVHTLHVKRSYRWKDDLHHRLTQVFDVAAGKIYHDAQRTRRMAYALAYAGEAEAIGRSLLKPMDLKLTRHDLDVILDKTSPSGGSLASRIRLALSRLQRDVTDAIERIVIIKGVPDKMIDSIDRAFPSTKRFKRIPRALKNVVREAAKDDEDEEGSLSLEFTKNKIKSGFIDQETWNDLVSEYKTEHELDKRTPQDVTRVKMGKDTYELYDWELEKELTQDYVELVRAGAVDAANDNGIDDFVWIAIIDDSTDECCVWRDGLTTTEIAEQLKGAHSDDECQTEVPPAHFNCRCDLAPMTDAMPDVKRTDLGDFDQWLK